MRRRAPFGAAARLWQTASMWPIRPRPAPAAPLLLGALAAALLLAPPGPATAGPLCRVADPTGTPLNVRTAPNFKIVGALPNGARVEILQTVTGDDGKQWAFVADAADGRAHGWVFRRYLDCR